MSVRMMMFRVAAAVLVLTVCAGAVAQMGRPRAEGAQGVEPPDLSPAVERVLGQLYLTQDELTDLRIFHGQWRDEDLNTPERRARAALILGLCDDPSLHDGETPALLRAEGAAVRGNYEAALELLEGDGGVRAARLRAEALEALGRFAEADEAVDPIARRLIDDRLADAGELTDAVRALRIRARVRGLHAGDYRNLMDLLARAQQGLDRLHWPALVQQAELLYEKDNRGQAAAAALEALSLNPRIGAAWAILGRLGVDSFAFDRAAGVGFTLDALAGALTGDPMRTHPQSDIIAARAALRQNDPEGAMAALAPTLARCPSMRMPLALHAAATAITYDYDAAEALVEAFDRLSPGSPLALFEVGRALAENRQYEAAAGFLERASERQPNWADPHIELGLLEMQSGRDTRALTALRRAAELDPFNVRASNSLVLVEELTTYDSVESEHFIVRFRPGEDRVMAEEMLEPLEAIHRIVTEGIDFSPTRKTVIELLPDHEWFAVRITGMTGIHTIAAATGPVIAMEAPRIGKRNNGPYDWERVLRHEYVHTVTLERTRNRIPLWFTEAAAVFLEGAPRDYSTCQMLVAALEGGGLFDMEEINIAFVRPKRPTDRGQAYAQGHWMYQYIVERWGPRAPLEMMDLYGEGMREREVMERVLGISQAQFLADFTAWARADAASWGMLPEPEFRGLLVLDALEREASRSAMFMMLARLGLASMWAGAPEGELLLPVPPSGPAVIERLAERWPEHPDVLGAIVQVRLRQAGDTVSEEMVPLLERYAAARPVDPLPHRHLARFYLGTDRPERAIPHLEFLDAREQKSPAYAVELARRYAALEEWERAWAKIVRATRIAPFDGNQRELAASVAIRRGDLAAAERQVKALTVLEPDQAVHRQRLERIRELRAQDGAGGGDG